MPFQNELDDRRAHCIGCGNALAGLTAPRCPECGRGFRFGDASTWAPEDARAALARRLRRPPGVKALLAVSGLGIVMVCVWSAPTVDVLIAAAMLAVLASAAGVIGLRVLLAAVSIARGGVPGGRARGGDIVRWVAAPALTGLAAWMSLGGAARELRWRISEPWLRAEAQRALAAPPAGGPWSVRYIGLLGVREITVVDGRVRFLTVYDSLLYTAELVYSPGGPAPPGEALGGGWTLVMRDMF